MTDLFLPARQPFSFRSTVRSHGWCQLAPFVWDEDSRVLNYLLRLSGGRVAALRISEAPGGVQVNTFPQVSAAEQPEIAAAVTWMLGLDMDFSSLYALAAREPKLQRMEPEAMGRVLRSATVFEDVIRTILTTNTLWAATIRMNAALVAQFGDPLDGGPPAQFGPIHPLGRAFPTPERLAAATEAVLRAETRLGYRAPSVLRLAQAAASGALDLEALKGTDLPTPELRKQLLAIRGVGPYAAAVLLLILGRYDSIPVDSWALAAVSKEWHAGGPVTGKDVEARFAGWGDWRGLAYWFWEWAE